MTLSYEVHFVLNALHVDFIFQAEKNDYDSSNLNC